MLDCSFEFSGPTQWAKSTHYIVLAECSFNAHVKHTLSARLKIEISKMREDLSEISRLCSGAL